MGLSPEILGWFSSCVLVVTIGRQVYRQWQSGHSEGVSSWLFVGQMVASSGFTLYSWLIHSWVFVVTNFLMLCSAAVGWMVVRLHRRQSKERGAPSRAPPVRLLRPQRL